MSLPESPDEQALRTISDTAVRAFSREGAGSVGLAAAMVALGAISSGDSLLARELFETALNMTPSPDRQANLHAWGLWAARADSAPAAVALAHMGLDWHTAEAPESNYHVQLGQALLHTSQARALTALCEAGLFDPLRSTRDSRLVAFFGSRRWLAWAALDTHNHDNNTGAFCTLLEHPRVRQDAQSLSDALWVLLQYPGDARDAQSIRALLEAGADPFLPQPIGARVDRMSPSSGGPGRCVPRLINPLLHLGLSWFSSAEREAVAARAGQWSSYANLVCTASSALHEAKKDLSQAGTVASLSQALQCLEDGNWPDNTLEKHWDAARDLISFCCSGPEGSHTQLPFGARLWAASAASIDWANAPVGKEGLSVLGFLMSQRLFGVSLRTREHESPNWVGRELLQTLLEAGVSLDARWPEHDPKEIALALAMNNQFGPFELLCAHADRSHLLQLSASTLGHAANFLIESTRAQLRRQANRGYSSLRPRPFEVSPYSSFLRSLSDRAQTPELNKCWTQFVLDWEGLTDTISEHSYRENNPECVARLERLALQADALGALPSVSAATELESARSRSPLRL